MYQTIYTLKKVLILLLIVNAFIYPAICSAKPKIGFYQSNFQLLSPLASTQEISNRMLHLGVKIKLKKHFADHQQDQNKHSIDTKAENWNIYVPENYDPKKSYGLFVWIDASEKASVPKNWFSVFGDYDLIFVAADKSGNLQNDLDRRIPLALHAVENMQQLYHIDPKRIYISGLSGGARVASHIAIGYGDIFRGGLFIAGNDSIGSISVPVPNAEILSTIQKLNRYVFLTGRYDEPVIKSSRLTEKSYQHFCITNLRSYKPRMGHGLPKKRFLIKALNYLEYNYKTDNKNNLQECNDKLEQNRREFISNLQTAYSNNKYTELLSILKKIQLQFGGLLEKEFYEYYTKYSDLIKQ